MFEQQSERTQRKMKESLELLKDMETTEKELAKKREEISIDDFRESIAPDPTLDDGLRPITWTQLHEVFGFEKTAHGFAIVGDVCSLDRETWSYNKYLRLRDADGRDESISFNDEGHTNNKLCDATLEEVELGSQMALRSPRFHHFLDGNDGIRVECTYRELVRHKKQVLSDELRFQYALIKKREAEKLFKRGKYETAAETYDTAINHITCLRDYAGSPLFVDNLIKCYLNVAMCYSMANKPSQVQPWCRDALSYCDPDPSKQQEVKAKAYFRMACAAHKLDHLDRAMEFITEATRFVNSPEVANMYETIRADIKERNEAERAIFKNAIVKKAAAEKLISAATPAVVKPTTAMSNQAKEDADVPQKQVDDDAPAAPAADVKTVQCYRMPSWDKKKKETATDLRRTLNALNVHTVIDVDRSNNIVSAQALDDMKKTTKTSSDKNDIDVVRMDLVDLIVERASPWWLWLFCRIVCTALFFSPVLCAAIKKWKRGVILGRCTPLRLCMLAIDNTQDVLVSMAKQAAMDKNNVVVTCATGAHLSRVLTLLVQEKAAPAPSDDVSSVADYVELAALIKGLDPSSVPSDDDNNDMNYETIFNNKKNNGDNEDDNDVPAASSDSVRLLKHICRSYSITQPSARAVWDHELRHTLSSNPAASHQRRPSSSSSMIVKTTDAVLRRYISIAYGSVAEYLDGQPRRVGSLRTRLMTSSTSSSSSVKANKSKKAKKRN
eukprot:PhM_4_TR4668/c0_g1_i1/m.9208